METCRRIVPQSRTLDTILEFSSFSAKISTSALNGTRKFLPDFMMKNAFFSRYGFRILVVVFFLLPLIYMGTNRTFMSNSNNVADWLPDSFEETHQYQWFLEHFPFERFVVVSWNGCTMDDPDGAVEMFAQKLVPGQTIDNIGDWATENLQAELALDGSSSAVESVSPAPDSTSLGTALSVASGSPSEPPGWFKNVLTGPRLFRMLKDKYDGEGIGGIRLSDEEIQRKLQGILVGPDGKSTALLVTLTKEAPQGKALREVLEAIRDIGRECGVHPQKIKDDRFFLIKAVHAVWTTVTEMIYGRTPDMSGVILGGPPVDNVAITNEGEQTLQRLIGLCGLIGLGLAWLCFRDVRLTMFIFWTAIISAGVALASVSFTGGTCDAILLSMPALVYVLAMSGSIHLINYYHDAIREHGLDMGPERAVKHALSPCFFANFTTALGLISLCWSGLIPISKFGFYAALGIMLQLILLFFYLPALLYFYPSHRVAAQRTLNIESDAMMQRIWQVVGGFMIRNSTVVAVGCCAAMFFVGYGMYQIKTSVKMMRFFSPDAEIIHHYTWLEEHLGPLVPMEIVIKFDNHQCGQMITLERLRLIETISNALRDKLGENIGGIMSVETMTPPPPPVISGPKSLKQISYERGFSRNLDNARYELRDFVAVEGNFSFLPTSNKWADNLEQIGISEEDAARLVRAKIDDLKKLVNLPSQTELPGFSYEELKELREKAFQWLAAHGTDLWRISLRVWSLKKEDIDYALFIQDVKEVVRPILDKANEDLELEENNQAIEAMYTGMVPVVYKTQHVLLLGLRDSFISSFIMIGITMSFILRSPLAGFLAMLPNIFPVFIVFGFMGQFGFLVDVGTMMTASVALGISTDDTIHFLTWFRHGIDQGMSRGDATRFAYSRCATAMFQTTLIAGLGLATFALSTFTPTQMFGVMMLAILSTATFGDLIFLAALLNTPLGRVFEPRKKKPPAESSR